MQVHTSHRMPNFFGGIVNNGDVSIYRFESQVASLSKKINFWEILSYGGTAQAAKMEWS